MVFKRRNRRGLLRTVVEFIWPRGGWARAASYVLHRLRRLPDTPHRICLGIACGTLVSFWPIFGLHFVSAALLAWLLRGNILAALLGTFVGNPLTFPLIAVGSMELGSWLLGHDVTISFGQTMAAIARASSDLWRNLWAPLTGAPVHWNGLRGFFWRVFLPYTLGGTILGIPCAILLYYLSRPLVVAYQRHRLARLKARFEAARARDRMETDLP